MRLSLGIGAVFLPIGLLVPAQRWLASGYASRLSEVATQVAAVLGPSACSTLVVPANEVPRQATVVPDDSEEEPVAAGAKTGKSRGRSDRTGALVAQRLPAIYVPAHTVLRIANSGQRPTGQSVVADGRRPAGVQVFGASSLGVGVRDGDVITRVAGVPVTTANQIIALVIAARGAKQPAITATVFRGQRSYMLTVEQPYLPGADKPPSSEPTGAPGAPSGADIH